MDVQLMPTNIDELSRGRIRACILESGEGLVDCASQDQCDEDEKSGHDPLVGARSARHVVGVCLAVAFVVFHLEMLPYPSHSSTKYSVYRVYGLGHSLVCIQNC
jgi:hypothetical protein